MLIFRIALRNLFRHPVKNLLIGSLISVGTGLLFCANAVFENTNRGLETSFIRSLTGDIAVGAKGEEVFGIFGNEIPIINEYQGIPPIPDFLAVSQTLNADPSIQRWTPIVSAIAQVSIGGYIVKCPVFGVDSSSYFSVCSDLAVESGNLLELADGGVFFNAELVETAETSLGRRLTIGEPVVFSMFANGSFRVRRGVFSGVYRYPSPTEAMNRIVLADPVIVRALCDYTQGYALANLMATKGISAKPTQDLDELFSDTEDTVATPQNEFSLTDLETKLADTAERDAMVMTDASAWSFVLVRVKPGANTNTVRETLAQELSRKQVEARVMDWRTTAGSTALLLFAVRAAFNVGIGVLIFGAGLIVMNALVISVLERTNEIGTMRALGAGLGFIRSLFVLETMILTILAAALGIICGALLSFMLAQHGIPLTNPLLVTLFGGTVVRPLVEPYALVTHFVGAILIASFAWIYPVSLALKIEPASAMAER